MYHFEIIKNKKEEFVLGLRAKNGELIFKTEGYATKAHAKKMATKILGLTEETEIRDLTIVPKVDKAAAKNAPAKKPAAKKAQKDTESAE